MTYDGPRYRKEPEAPSYHYRYLFAGFLIFIFSVFYASLAWKTDPSPATGNMIDMSTCTTTGHVVTTHISIIKEREDCEKRGGKFHIYDDRYSGDDREGYTLKCIQEAKVLNEIEI